MTDTETLIQAITNRITSQPLYHYDTAVVQAVCEAGIDGIPIGTCICEMSGQRLVRDANDIVCLDADGAETRRTPIAGCEDDIITMYAISKSQLGSSMGSF